MEFIQAVPFFTFGINGIAPNPFFTTTTLEYQPPTATTVSLKTYDISGNCLVSASVVQIA